MKILHVVQCYYPAVGGAEALAKNFSEQLANRHNDDVTVFTAAATKPAYFWRDEGEALPAGIETINNVTVRRFQVFRKFNYLRGLLARGMHRLRLPYNDRARTFEVGPLIFDLPDAIVQHNADVVMATTFPFKHMYDAVLGAKRANVPVVLIGAIHVDDAWGYERKMMFEAIAQADAYVALTPFERDYLIERGILANKIHVIGGGVYAKPFLQADGQQIREKYGLGNDLVVTVMSRQSELKRLGTVLDAMPLVWETYPDVRLLMAGARTNYSAVLDAKIAQLPTAQQERIVQIHNFPEAEKAEILAASDIFVHPSGHESFGIVFVEAWATGCPIIGTRVGAVASLIDEEIDGLLYDFGDEKALARQILRFVKNADLREKMGRAGQQKVLQNYTWEIVADRLRLVYESLVD